MVLGDIINKIFTGNGNNKIIRRHTISDAHGKIATGKENSHPKRRAKRRILDDFALGK